VHKLRVTAGGVHRHSRNSSSGASRPEFKASTTPRRAGTRHHRMGCWSHGTSGALMRFERRLLTGMLSVSIFAFPARWLFGQNRPSTAYEAAAARRDTSLRIIVSIARRRLWAVAGAHDTLLDAPVAVGSQQSLAYGAQHWTFQTPRGIHTVLAKEA